MAESDTERSSKRETRIIGGIVSLVAFSIFMISKGASDLNHCKIQPMIPIYLIVAGSGQLLFLLLLLLYFLSEKATIVIEGILIFFLFCWFIAGSYWVFSARIDMTTSSSDCSYFVYITAFIILIAEHIITGIILVGLIIWCCGCRVRSLPSRNNGETTNLIAN
ncbi:transmembrane protein 272-like [Hyperolius riggenbachi]|uniref:transmembrane protein 272-like n=1 Tax=Hyperolius riggenbachi TaxID=752182 RepID=UPI0035A3B156